MKRPERIEGAIIHRAGAPLRSAKPDARSRAPPVFGFLRWRFEITVEAAPPLRRLSSATPLRACHVERLAAASHSPRQA
jgi:hypothetical protein